MISLPPPKNTLRKFRDRLKQSPAMLYNTRPPGSTRHVRRRNAPCSQCARCVCSPGVVPLLAPRLPNHLNTFLLDCSVSYFDSGIKEFRTWSWSVAFCELVRRTLRHRRETAVAAAHSADEHGAAESHGSHSFGDPEDLAEICGSRQGRFPYSKLSDSVRDYLPRYLDSALHLVQSHAALAGDLASPSTYTSPSCASLHPKADSLASPTPPSPRPQVLTAARARLLSYVSRRVLRIHRSTRISTALTAENCRRTPHPPRFSRWQIVRTTEDGRSAPARQRSVSIPAQSRLRWQLPLVRTVMRSVRSRPPRN
ncbi:hypothetical protein OH77DRAFT_16226 [Trametes cingulata]|nr:hypothetical protein OH77DRAFT_16226 [Trametes cingulata]